MSFELYSNASSFYSLRAQLALRAKGIEYSIRDVNLMEYGNLQPWYLRINPAGKVPTLRHGKIIVPDSSAIITYLDQTCDGLKLQPDIAKEPGRSIRQLYDKIDAIDVPTITLGYFVHPELAAVVKISEKRKLFFREKLLNNRDKDVLETLMNENPELKDFYKDRLKTAQNFDAKVVFSRQNLEKTKKEALSVLKEIELHLNKMNSEYEGSWLFGSDITAADVALLTTLFRFSNLGLDKEMWEGRLPKLESYFNFAKEIFPGFQTTTAGGF